MLRLKSSLAHASRQPRNRRRQKYGPAQKGTAASSPNMAAQRPYNKSMKVQMYAASWCPDCRQARQFLDSHGIEYSVIDVDADRAASEEVLRRVGKRAVPQLVIDGEWFQPYKPGRGLLIEELHQRLGIPR